ncbi:MAG: S-layer homology domain-containing protein [Patescibacteria group bacterium]|nr:S-layer homology domain-containing protein [Patescibacteria group bacterium]
MFSDTADHWGREAIDLLVEKSIVKGYSSGPYEGMFLPDHPATRAELLKMAFVASGRETITNTLSYFEDIDSEYWYYSYVNSAPLYDIIDGSKAYFYPNNSITRAQAVKIIVESFDFSDDPVFQNIMGSSFTDVSEFAWYRPHIEYFYIKGIV